MAPTLTTLTSLLRSATITARSNQQPDIGSLGPLNAHTLLLARDEEVKVDPGKGIIHPHDINNNALFALFGIIGAAFVITGIWFFFWAKNGGFIFKENDWEDYKSTVMRRKGPNGTLLSGATPSTQLGGGSIYKDVDDATTNDASTVISATTGITGITGGVSDIYGREKRRKKREQKEREKDRRREEKEREKEEGRRGKSKTRRKVGADGALIDEDAEAEAKAHLRKYRHEKPARVGGINKESEGSSWDGSTNPSHSTMSGSGSGVGYSTETGSTVTSELITNRERTPTSTPTKKTESRGIRKVYSTADKNATRENERLRAEAKKLQEKGRASSSRRDFSWQKGADETMALRRIDEGAESMVSGSSRVEQPRVPGSWAESDVGTETDLGTKVYRHPVHIPVSSSSAVSSSNGPSGGSELSYAEEKRKKRGGAGYRRARGGEGESGV